jgi:hypothetical protein
MEPRIPKYVAFGTSDWARNARAAVFEVTPAK